MPQTRAYLYYSLKLIKNLSFIYPFIVIFFFFLLCLPTNALHTKIANCVLGNNCRTVVNMITNKPVLKNQNRHYGWKKNKISILVVGNCMSFSHLVKTVVLFRESVARVDNGCCGWVRTRHIEKIYFLIVNNRITAIMTNI